jgi:hypothetical protein
MMRANRFGIGAALTASIVLIIGLNTFAASAATQPASPGNGARFVTSCSFSHQLPDDPIVKPNLAGASHSHDFFGNTKTNAFTTLASLNSATTTCVNRLDKSGYWVPSLTLNGSSVLPSHASIYYYRPSIKASVKIKTIPSGLKVVAGDAHATTPQSTKVTTWDCGPDVKIPATSTVPTCPTPTLLLHVMFPSCWNGKDLDSPDHKSHLAYPSAGACPAAFPVAIPRIRLNVSYDITGGPGVALASGGQYSGHADFFNAWNPAELQRLITKCINGGLVCDVNA